MKRLVADTGPILHLHEAGAIHLLPLVGKVIMPPSVLAELNTHAPTLWPGPLPHHLKLQTLSPAAQHQALGWQKAGLLHGGEAEALALALELKPDWFLTDDAAAHKGVGNAEAEALLAAWEKSSLWMSPRVRAEARAALAKLFGGS